MEIKSLLVKDIKYAPYNPRRISEEVLSKLKRSIEEFGYIEPIVVNKRTMHVVGGNQRLKVLRQLDIKEVQSVIVDLDDTHEKALNIALNKINGEWDLPALKDLLLEIDTGEIDIELTGFEMPEIEELMNQFHIEGEEDNFNVDEAVEEIKEPTTKTGDIWLLGKHRVMCGDSTMIDDVDKLMDKNTANICFTSPPYNASQLNIKGNETTKKKYAKYNDDKTEAEYFDFLTGNINAIMPHVDEIFYNIGIVENNKRVIIALLYQYKEYFKDVIYWKKTTCAPHIQPGVINNLVEWILCFGDGKRKFKNATFKQGSYWNVIEGRNASGNEYAEIHKATFPVYLPANIIENFTQENGIVLDCFGGTGTTLIAAEQLNRTCYMMELDPKYCDVIIKRWQDFTGKQATLEATGETFEDVSHGREAPDHAAR